MDKKKKRYNFDISNYYVPSLYAKDIESFIEELRKKLSVLKISDESMIMQ